MIVVTVLLSSVQSLQIMPTKQAKRRKYRQQLYAEQCEHKPDKTEGIRATWRKASKERYDTNLTFRKSKIASSCATSKAKYEANPDAKKASSKAQYEANPDAKKASSKAQYEANPDAKKASSKAQYEANPDAKKASSKAQYEANPDAKKASSKAQYEANPDAKKASSKAQYEANPDAKKASSKAQYEANPDAKKAISKAQYEANPDAKKAKSKASSKAQYQANPDAKKAKSKASSKAQYQANPDAKKAKSKASSKAQYQANPESKKKQSRKAYLNAINRARKLVSGRTYYSKTKHVLSAYRKARYVLSEPKADVKNTYVYALKTKLIGNRKHAVKLMEAFKKKYQSTAKRLTRTGLTIAVCRIAAKRVLNRTLQKRKQCAGELLSAVRAINNLVIPKDFGPRCHTASSEPYFYDAAYTCIKQRSVIPVDEQGKCFVADEIEHDKQTGCLRKWKCTAECKLPTDDEVASIQKAKDVFKLPMPELRHELENIDSGCENGHYVTPCSADPVMFPSNEDDPSQRLMGHPLTCASGNCESLLRIVRAASTHYPLLRRFHRLMYVVRQQHWAVHKIDASLCAADFNQLMELAAIRDFDDLFSEEVNACSEYDDVVPDCSVPGLPGIETQLQIKHAKLITELEKKVNDDPEHPCCSCERLFLKKRVTHFKLDDKKFNSRVWAQLKQHILHRNPSAKNDVMYVCQYCRPLLNKNKLPCRCILNGLETEPVPPELSNLDPLSKQLIQRAKAFQTVVRLGTYTAKVPSYNSLRACKGTMFFLPLPLSKTVETLDGIDIPNGSTSSAEQTLPSPELYIMVNGKVTKSKVVWRSIVDVSALRAALHTLKRVNVFYRNVSDASVDEATKEVIETVDSTTSSMLVKASKEDVANFQKLTIRSLNQKHNTTSDIEQYKLLHVNEDALDSRQKFLDVLCFPHLFPSGKFGEFHSRQSKISSSEYAKSRLLNVDPRFRKDAQYVFFLLWQKEMRELSAGIYNVLKKTGQHSMPVDRFLDKVSKSDQDVEGNLSTMFASVRGSKQYWFLRNSELRCMVRESGSPTLFLTFSCAEYDCPHITKYLRKVNNVQDSYPIGKLCAEDPISVSRKFSQKFHDFFNTVIIKGKVLGMVSHYFFKKEYQARGAPHYHVVLWIQDAPVIQQDPEQEVLKWIQERITCRIPDEATNPELHHLVTKYQMHKCSTYCKRRRKFKGAFITRCKFGFPRDESETAYLNDVDTCLKSRKKIYCLSRGPHEIRVNDYNPLLLLLWRANIDIQFIAESSLALAHYVTGYVTKAERSNMQDVWQEVSSNRSIYSRLWSFGIRSLRSRECGLYEASDLLLGDHLCEKSDTVKWIDAALPHKRNRRLRNHKDLVKLRQTNPNSTDVFEDNLIDNFYPERPTKLEDVCLYDYVRFYERCGKDRRGRQMCHKLTKPCLPNHKLYDPEKEGHREDYFYALILLFTPFRDEGDLIGEAETAEEAFNRLLGDNSNLLAHHDKLQNILAANRSVAKIAEAREQEQKIDPHSDNDGDDGPGVSGEARDTMKDVQDLQGHLNHQFSLEERVSMLNCDQDRIFKHVTEHLTHQQQHETGTCKCSALKPLQMFISGVGGTGKSFLIQTIQAKVAEIWKEQTSGVTCVVAAPTGIAAFNIGGVTVHRLFQLPIEHEGKTAEYWSLPKGSQKMLRTTLRDLKLVIVDEVSMLSSLNLAYMHLRLDEVFSGNDWFGSRNILFVGDLLQLPPVNGAPVFEKLHAKAILTRLGCMTSVNIWKETVVYDELTVNERQKEDAHYSELLNEVRRGVLTDETKATLQTRLIHTSVVDKFEELQSQGHSPVCLFPTRKACSEFNCEMLCRLSAETVEIPCIDDVDETAGPRKWNQKAAEQLEKLNQDCNMTAGLEAVLRVAIGARVMLRRNIDTAHGLVNGAIGTVTSISAQYVTIKFDHNGQTSKIAKVKSKFQVMKRFYVFRKQFPLILAYAVTIHKCQGLSLNCAIIDLSEQVFSPGMAYVALSRVRSLSGLHLIAFDPNSVMISNKCLHEVNRLRQLYTKHLPLYDVPCVLEPRKGTKRKLSAAAHSDQPNPPQKECKTLPPQRVPTKRKRADSSQPKTPPPKKSKLDHPLPTFASLPPNPPVTQLQEAIATALGQTPLSLLHHIASLPIAQLSWTVNQHKRSLDAVVNILNNMPTQFAESNPDLSQDTTATLQCHPLLLETFKPVVTNKDNNCLYNALSLVLTSSQELHASMRLLCVYALIKHRRDMLDALTHSYRQQSRSFILTTYTQSIREAATLGIWGHDLHLFALSILFCRPILQYNTFYYNLSESREMELILADTRDVHHLAQRFRDGDEGTRTHLLYCSTPIAHTLSQRGLNALRYPPLTIYHINQFHWVAMLPRTQSVLPQIPVPTVRLLHYDYAS